MVFSHQGVAIIEEANRIKAQIEELLRNRQNLTEEVERQLIETSRLVNEAYEQQHITADLLAETHAAEGKAKEAVEKAEMILEEAKNTLQTLEGVYVNYT